ATAERFLAGGRHLWNAGIFVFRGDALLGHLRRLAPELWEGLARLAAAPARLSEHYPPLPSITIDHAVMEKLEEIAILPLDCGWNDLGSWGALAEVLPADERGNAARGELVAVEAGENLVFAEQGTVALLGVSGLVVVRTDDAVLVMPRERAQEVRRIVDELARRRREGLL
ncbi:MAG: mannose-1-phosphate guanylyltransferase, partial [Thermoanaerobaculia bacterium]|nr:mannose-1-phosphate guanylyltransferase [Thermoanaerobaculia bacterium]